MKKRLLLLCAVLVVVASLGPEWLAAQGRQKAGDILAMLPQVQIVRGTAPQLVTTEAAKGGEVFWNDLIKTGKTGRARVRLLDQSLLSVGSQTELRVVSHDPKSQQTQLEMTYGRVRSQVTRMTQGGKMEVRTPTAVAGVIGTDFGTISSVGGTEFICLEGSVEVSNIDPNVPGSVQCTAGMTTTVTPDNPPTPPQPATLQQMLQLIQDTEPSLVTALSPASLLPGTTVEINMRGSELAGLNQLDVSGAGVTVNLTATGESLVRLQAAAAADAESGPRVVTLSGEERSAVGVFMVIALPDLSGDREQVLAEFLRVLQQEQEAAQAEVAAIMENVRQSADRGLDQLETANGQLPQPLDLAPAENELDQQEQGAGQAAEDANQGIQRAGEAAASAFQSAFDSAYSQFMEQEPPDQQGFQDAILASFNQINGDMLSGFDGLYEDAFRAASHSQDEIGQIVARWLEQIEQAVVAQGVSPTPSAGEAYVALGDDASFDGSRSSAGGGAEIVSYEWALCGSSYSPSTFGQVLPGNDAQCSPLPGFTATGSEFEFPTCSLQPGQYAVRLRVTDSNGQSAAMDGRLVVLSPGYDDPAQRLYGLAAAYESLQPEQFMAFFDPLQFYGYTSLQENIRRTFDVLNSMSINLRVSQTELNCNVANLRAEWEQKYTFQTDSNTVFSQSRQLTVRMVRNPGRGWYIADFQGDNGTLQGVPPGPIQTDTALPDLEILSVLANGVAPASPLNVNIGSNLFTAVVANTGEEDLTQQATVQFSLRNDANQEIAQGTAEVPVPLAQGEQVEVSATIVVPELAPGTPGLMVATANPGCAIIEANCDSRNIFNQDVLIASFPDLTITSNRNNTVGQGGTRLQLNGPLPETLLLTVNPVGGGSGSADLSLTDPATVTSTPGSFQGVAFGAPAATDVAAVVGGDGNVSATTADVTATATATAFTPPAVLAAVSPGFVQETLLFNIGDIDIDAPVCVSVPILESASLSFNLVPINGFNATVAWEWISLGADLSADAGSGTASPNASLSFVFTSLSQVGSTVDAFFTVTISNNNGAATKFFPITFVIGGTCPVTPGLRVPGRGSWERAIGGGSGSLSVSPQIGALPDLRIDQSSISFAPSLPRAGDTLQVRFRLTNAGSGDAQDVPVVLEVSGKTVASETFDVRAGASTLAVLEWNVAGAELFSAPKFSRVPSRDVTTVSGSWGTRVQASLLVDPTGSIRQASTTGKSATLRNLNLGTGGESLSSASLQAGALHQVLLEVGDRSCLGLNLTSGVGWRCEGADLEIRVDDLAEGRYSLASDEGVADLGVASFASQLPAAGELSFQPKLAAQAGHTYAVRLSDGSVRYLTVTMIRSPQQLEALARRKFGREAVDGLEGMGMTREAQGGARTGPQVYFQVVYRE